MKVRIMFAWSDWLIGVDWWDREFRVIMEGWAVHFRLGPAVLQVRRDYDENTS